MCWCKHAQASVQIHACKHLVHAFKSLLERVLAYICFVEAAKEAKAAKEAEAAKAKEAIETLKERLHKAESQKGSAGGETDEVAALKSTLVEKDARIKKLEKSKITKQQIQNIQKLKVSGWCIVLHDS